MTLKLFEPNQILEKEKKKVDEKENFGQRKTL